MTDEELDEIAKKVPTFEFTEESMDFFHYCLNHAGGHPADAIRYYQAWGYKYSDERKEEMYRAYHEKCDSLRPEFYRTVGRKYMIKMGFIRLANGSRATYVAEFNNKYSHIIVDDNCWVLVNGDDGAAEFSAWIFKEAKEILDQLPVMPSEYKPFVDYINSKN